MRIHRRSMPHRGLSVQPENREQSRIDPPLLLRREATGQIPEPIDINSADLFDEDNRPSSVDLDLGPERCRLRTPRCGRQQHNRTRKERIGLHDDTVSLSSLLVAYSLGKAKSKDVTPAHADAP